MRRLLAVAIVLATSLAVSVSQAAAQSPQPSAGCSRTPMAERFIASFPVDGVQRTALVNVPAAASGGKPLPLTFMFHGAGGNALGTESSTGLTQAATRYGFIVVGYVVMPEHIHLLISEPNRGTPSTVRLRS